MKFLIVLLPLMLSLKATAQKTFVGQYHDAFGSKIELNSDSTFKFTFNFCLTSSWTKGILTINNNTLYLKMVPIYDTLKYTGQHGKLLDSLVLSVDENPGQVTLEETAVVSSGGQNIMPYPDKLFYKNHRLYKIADSGKLIKKKVKGFGYTRKHVPWFVKDTVVSQKRDNLVSYSN